MPWLLAEDIHLANVWVPTDMNPADHPSRGHDIPPAKQGVADPLLDPRALAAVQVHHPAAVQKGFGQETQRAGKDSTTVGQHQDNPELFRRTPKIQNRQEQEVHSSIPDRAAVRPALSFREIVSGKGHLAQRARMGAGLRVLDSWGFLMTSTHNSPNILDDRAFIKLCQEARSPNQLWHFLGFLAHFSRFCSMQIKAPGAGIIQEVMILW